MFSTGLRSLCEVAGLVKNNGKHNSALIAYQGIQDSLGFWIPRREFRILGTGFWILCHWNLDRKRDSRFLELYSGFRIPLQKFAEIRIPFNTWSDTLLITQEIVPSSCDAVYKEKELLLTDKSEPNGLNRCDKQ